MSEISELLEGFSSLLDQSNNTTMSFDAPMPETVEATDMAGDGKTFADEVFTGKLRIPTREMAQQEAYDMSQAFARIMKLYQYTRSDFYNLAVQDNAVRRARLAWKTRMLENLSGE